MYGSRKKTVRQMLWAALAAVLCIALSVTAAWAAPPRRLIPSGQAVGIKLFADGVLVVGTSDLEGDVSPAEQCGLREGDQILRIDGQSVDSTECVQAMVAENGTDPMELDLRRDGKRVQTTIRPHRGSDGVCRLGAWIRDSMAGIGTLTYVDPATGDYGALGHGITDVDTHRLMPLRSGSVMETTVRAVKKGAKGDPGELKGDFTVQRDAGTLTANTDGGIFGRLRETESSARALEVAHREEVHTGPATIRATVAGDETREYDVKIVRIWSEDRPTRNFLVEVTDPALLEATGGIVQGMSGSPVLQDGKLVGAVTHVLVNDPARGYGIFMENMLEAGS